MKITHEQQAIVNQAITILGDALRNDSIFIDCAKAARDYLSLNLASREHEVFAVMFLDNQHRLIEYVEMFRGTINGASVYPREVAKEALARNAAAVILAHNHPSGVAEPSQADKRITERLVTALELFDIRVLDHVVVGNTNTVSFAESGLL